MNNFAITFKKVITNKNTITIIGILVILALLYWGYSSTVKKSVDPINIPVAAHRLLSEQKITNDDISYQKVSQVVVGSNVIRNASEIVGKYTNLNVTIPEGSMFYSEWLTTINNLPGKWIEAVDFANGEEAYYYHTDIVETLGNSVLPGSYIDIYMTAEDENGNLMFGKLLENIKILAVHDGGGKNIFYDASNIGSPSYLGFALSHDLYILLNKAERLGGYGIELILAPQGVTPQKVSEGNTVLVGSETLRDYIDANTVSLTDEHIESKQNDTTENTLNNMINNVTNNNE